jgi:hypothetical protein
VTLRRAQKKRRVTMFWFTACFIPLGLFVHFVTGSFFWMAPYMLFLPVVVQPPRFSCPRCGQAFFGHGARRSLEDRCANCGIWAGTPNIEQIGTQPDETKKLEP